MAELVSLKSRIPTSVPDFINEDHPIFVKFVEAYYEYLERENGPIAFVRDALKYISPSESLDSFVKYFFEEIKDIPPSAMADRRLLAQHIYELYQAKGTVKSFELFFRMMYNENIQVYFPKDDIIKTSDGKWDRVYTIRVQLVKGNVYDMIGNVISQKDAIGSVTASATVENVIGRSDTFFDVYLSPNSIVGSIEAGVLLKFGDVECMPVSSPVFKILSRGSGYSNGDSLKQYSAIGLSAKVKTVLPGSVDKVYILEGGSGHFVGERFIVESNTGSDLDIRVSRVEADGSVTEAKIVNGGQGFLEFPRIYLENLTGKFLVSGNNIGAVGDIRILDPGYNYTTPPSVSIDTQAILTDPTSGFNNNESISVLPSMICTEEFYSFKNEDGSFLMGEDPDTFSLEATISNVDYTNNSAKISGILNQIPFRSESGTDTFIGEGGEYLVTEKSSRNITRRTIVGDTTGARSRVLYCSPATLESSLSPIYDGGSKYLNLDGRLSEFTKRLQDSRYYQEFSYVIRSGQSIDTYRNALYNLLHPAGLALFGMVDIESKISSISRIIPQVATILQQVIELYIKNTDYILADNELIIESWASVFNENYRDSKFLEANKFNFVPRSAAVSGTPNTYMRQMGYIANEEFNKNFMLADVKDMKFTDLYEYVGHPPVSPTDTYYSSEYYSLNNRRTKFTWVSEMSGFGQSFMLTELGEVVTTEAADNITI